MTDDALAGEEAMWMRFALGRPETCTEGIQRGGFYDTCDKVAVALRYDPEEHEPYPVCSRHARGEMVSLEAIVRFMLDRHQMQRLTAQYFVDIAS